jgi:RNA polymerase sigma-70 factor (ECF subfamily)
MACERATATADQELVEAILSGDAQAFESLHARYRDKIFRFAVKRLGDPSEAEDVTQEVFLHVFRCLASFEGRSSLLTWMFGIAHNQVCRRFRRQKPLTVSIEDPEVMGLQTPDARPDRQVEAARILERCADVVERELSPAQQSAFQMRYGENRSTRYIAGRMGKSSQAVKIGLFRARRLLQERTRDLHVALSA